MHIDILDKAGLPSPPCFMRLPTDIQIKILELLLWTDLGKMACVCSAMKVLASDEQLWEKRYGEVLGEVDVAGAWETRWKDKFGASIWRKKVMERDMARRRFHGPWWPLTSRPHPQAGVLTYETGVLTYETNEEDDEEDDDEDESPFKPLSAVLTYDKTYENAYESFEDDCLFTTAMPIKPSTIKEVASITPEMLDT